MTRNKQAEPFGTRFCMPNRDTLKSALEYRKLSEDSIENREVSMAFVGKEESIETQSSSRKSIQWFGRETGFKVSEFSHTGIGRAYESGNSTVCDSPGPRPTY